MLKIIRKANNTIQKKHSPSPDEKAEITFQKNKEKKIILSNKIISKGFQKPFDFLFGKGKKLLCIFARGGLGHQPETGA